LSHQNSPRKRLPSLIGCKFIAARGGKGLTQEQLAREAQIPLLSLQAWETGPTLIDDLQKLLGALGATLHVTPDCIILDSKLPPADRPVMSKPSIIRPGLPENWSRASR